VNLLLIFLDRVEELPPPDSFPENVERAITIVEQKIGPGVASRLRMFLGKCTKLGIQPRPAKALVPFRRHAFLRYSHWENPKRYLLTVFYVIVEENSQGFWFPVNEFYSNVVDFDTDRLSKNLRDLGFVPTGKYRDFQLDLKTHNDQAFFDVLFELVERISQELEETLQ
jgi:hypothetical protein